MILFGSDLWQRMGKDVITPCLAKLPHWGHPGSIVFVPEKLGSINK